MYAMERHEHILDALARTGRVSVAGLADELDVTAETIRRDLDALEQAGHLRRVHGGAVSAGRASLAETTVLERTGQHADAKRAIAHEAMALVPPTFTGSILLDAGTTTGALAEALVGWQPATGTPPLTVYTNSVPIAALLHGSRDLVVRIIGGTIRGITSAAVGPSAIAQLAEIRPDIAFIGTNGVSAEFGLSTPDELEAQVKQAMVDRARLAVVLVDSSKHDDEALQRFSALDEVDVLITDAQPGPALAVALDEAEVEVRVA
ncbi:DeoR/GlpR family DNA-binding transcription regulator [Agromyces bracchium]|uniref:Lactose phosphotransferase system repressor n=1 Tax=Agromyces bracchium TaxID=88376 RepID=A0A6I3MAJ5_9MICO|nr:DeoR/GlpR family DNA-binding transcription regulator [Agromyces bracchium]MTH68376.1 DeoR family transcriptional regulator [Agromyces bracchium]